MRHRHLALIGGLSFAALAAAAAELEKGKAMYYGAGANLSCGQWLAQDQDTGIANRHWLLGFVSGVGAAGVHMKGTDAQAMFAWMDKYCREHPLDDLSRASAMLIKELIVRRKE